MNHDTHLWWSSLKHTGLLVAPAKLPEFFPDRPEPLSDRVAERLRRDVTRLNGSRGEEARVLMDTVLERVVGLGVHGKSDTGRWLKGNDVPTDYTIRAVTGEAIKPRRLWRGYAGEELPVFVSDDKRVGIGRGRRSAARVVEWLRRSDRKLALLTNARQWRLIYAGIDHEAFAEWDADLWFEEGQPSQQVAALKALLGPAALVSGKKEQLSPLEAAIEASRKGQAELSSVLGERVRQAVELLIQAHGEKLAQHDDPLEPKDIYLAATRIVMRLVVALFAEARDLLPRDNAIYHNSYGLGGLREELDRLGGGAGRERLRHRFGAWPRILAMFRLMYEGSPHEQLPIPRYGGGLFEPGDVDSSDGVRRALAVFESVASAPSDATVHRVLEQLTRTKIKVRQGRSSKVVEAPVDFSDLSTEYIGILYEGLLDFELRQVADDESVIFLALGDEPALPLSRLEAMDDKAIKALVEGFKKGSGKALASDDDGGEDEEEDVADEDTAADGGEEPEEEDSTDEEDDDRLAVARRRAEEWAARAIQVSGLIKKPRSKKSEAQREYEMQVARAAEKLAKKVVLPGEWYLVRFGGTRKGSGTFYTRPALAVPTVQRTLQPLAYDPPAGQDGPNEDAPLREWTPKKPEDILRLKVCDPGCGSGSFLVAGLRFLTEALSASLYAHGRIQEQGEATLVTLAEGRPSEGQLSDETLPCRPDAADFDDRLAARLKRYVVERCLYGVDLDPLAVELCRLALWVETLDRSLPFSFLDHKIKCGNSLVGCWFDRFQDYPALAFEREGGDKSHTKGVHFPKEGWTKAIKAFRNDKMKPDLVKMIQAQPTLLKEVDGKAPDAIHDEALAVLDRMHELPVHQTDERAQLYREEIASSPALQRLKQAFDTWCALWFWPADRLDEAPLPRSFATSSGEALEVVSSLRAAHRFLHWELEFPDVFASENAGFDALVGNPPWEIQKPNSKEYFSNLDPLYRTYGKQEALGNQQTLFEASVDHERDWLEYNATFKQLSNFTKNTTSPFGDGHQDGSVFNLGRGSKELHQHWRTRRAGRKSYADAQHPFRLQGSADINTYKLFLELGLSLLREGGQLGLIVPSGIYTDKGSTDLRTALLEHNDWQWLFGFENREGIFDIHRSFKFCPLIVRKGGRTDAIRATFMRRDVNDWAEGEKHVLPYEAEQVTRFSPNTRAILEIGTKRDLEILEKIYANSVLLGDQSEDGWQIQYAREFDMTNDSHLFPPRPKWETQGYKPDEYGRWLKGKWRKREERGPAGLSVPRWEMEPGVLLSQDGVEWIHEGDVEDTALPLYEGRMIGQFDFSEKGWVSGKGRSAVWEDIPWSKKVVRPQYLMGQSDAKASSKSYDGPKVSYMRISSATNARTTIATYLRSVPAGDSVFFFRSASQSVSDCMIVSSLLSSLVFDFQIRNRLGGLNMSEFLMIETGLPKRTPRAALSKLYELALSLCAPSPIFAQDWLGSRRDHPWRSTWALTHHERKRVRAMVDAIVGALFGLSPSDFRWILRDADNDWDEGYATKNLDPKGFWRCERSRPPELRHTVLSIIAFEDLTAMIRSNGGDLDSGVCSFCDQNSGVGWVIPETLRLAEYDLGTSERRNHDQLVAPALGDRLLEPQSSQSHSDSWKECELHARNMLGERDYRDLKTEEQPEGYGAIPDRNKSALPTTSRGLDQGKLF